MKSGVTGCCTVRQADFRCGRAADFFATASLAGFLPAIVISISFWPGVAFFAFLAGTWRVLAGPRPPATDALAQRVHEVDDVLARKRSFATMGLPARFWLISSIRAVSY